MSKRTERAAELYKQNCNCAQSVLRAFRDVTGMDDVDIGTVATLLGDDRGERITPEELAEWGGTIPYCLTTAIGQRVGRQYVE